jgi:hypothetical protein
MLTKITMMIRIKKLKTIVLKNTKRASNQYNRQEKECQGVDFCNQAPLNQQIIGNITTIALLTKISKLHHPQLRHHQYSHLTLALNVLCLFHQHKLLGLKQPFLVFISMLFTLYNKR